MKTKLFAGLLLFGISLIFLSLHWYIISICSFSIAVILLLLNYYSVSSHLRTLNKTLKDIKENKFSEKLSIGRSEFTNIESIINDIGETTKLLFKNQNSWEKEVKILISSIDAPIFVISTSGKTLLWNNATNKLLRNTENKDKNFYYYELLKSQGVIDFIKENISLNGFVSKAIPINNVIYEVNLFPWHGYSGRKISICIMKDITKREKIRRMEKNFINSISHELKTPISIIDGYAETLEANQLTVEEQKQFIKIIRRNSLRMKKLVEKFLKLNEIENLKEISNKKINLADIVKIVYKRNLLAAERKKISLIIDTEKDVVIRGEPFLIEEMIQNIVENAIRYTNRGTVKIAIYKDTFANIEISDTGIGIEEDVLPFIFNKFYRANSVKDKKEGTGLGLSIAKDIVKLHNGNISVKSKIGKGTTFIVQLPLYEE